MLMFHDSLDYMNLEDLVLNSRPLATVDHEASCERSIDVIQIVPLVTNMEISIPVGILDDSFFITVATLVASILGSIYVAYTAYTVRQSATAAKKAR